MPEPPRFFVFHGKDEFTQRETLAELKTRLGGDPSLVELNTTRFDGRTVRLGELMHACNSIPFLADKRLVVVDGLIEQLSDRARTDERESLLAYLPKLPPTTRLILLEKTTLPADNPFIRLAASLPIGYAKVFELPQGPALGQWIRERVAAQGGAITDQAVELLASEVGDDLRLLEMEISKLVTYTGLARPIQPADVELLTPYGARAGVFELVDAVGARRQQRAVTLLRSKLEAGEEPLRLMALIIRQFRLLIQVKERLDQRYLPNDISRELGIKPYPTGKLVQQAAQFTLAQLEDVYRRLLDTDVAIKTGAADAAVALELLTVELSNP